MKKTIKWYKFKCQVKNFIRVAIVLIAFLFASCSLVALVEASIKALVVFVISCTLMVLFGVANKGVFL